MPENAGQSPAPLTLSPVVALVLTVMAFAAVPFLLSPLLPDLADSFGLTAAQAGLAVSVFGGTLAVTAPLVGLCGGRLRRPLLIRAGLLLFLLGLVGAALAPGHGLLLAALAVAGLAGGMFLPTAYAVVGDHVPYQARGRVMGQVMAGWAYAIVIVVPLGGLLAHLAGWRTAFLLLAGVTAAALLASGALPRNPAPASGPVPTLRSLSSAVFLNPGAVLGLWVNLCNMVAFFGAYTYLGIWLRDMLHLSSDGAGLMIVAYGVGLAVATLNGRFLDLLGHRRALYLAHAGLAAGWVLLALVQQPVTVAVLLGWIGLTQGTALVGQSTLCSHQSDVGRGAIMALFTCTTYLGVFGGAALFGPIYSAQGYLTVVLLCGGLNLLATFSLHIGRYWLRGH